MSHYIDKDALVAEIERLKKKNDAYDKPSHIADVCYKEILSIIDTLEVKEVDLEKYYHDFLQKEWFGNSHVRTVSEMMAFTAKHFFELGMKTAQEGE